MPSSTGHRTVEQVDAALCVQRDERRRLSADIDSLSQKLGALRGSYTRAGRRIEALLDERNDITGRCPDTPEQLNPPGGRT
jgi:hypothetical protein